MELIDAINNKSFEILDKMTKIRRDLHRMPELALKEYKTSAYIVSELENMGLDVRREVAGTGVIANLTGDEKGKTIAIRADIDALPIQEHNNVEYKSKLEGSMHACGHDGHVAMAIGAAEILKSLKTELKGNVKFIFQPAEEQYGGAKKIIEAGGLKNPHVDAIIALHLWPDFNKGSICFKNGCIMASNDKLEIKIKGKGGHGGMPHLCIDALTIGCQVVNAVQTFVSREINPVDSVVVTFGTFHSGTTYNIVADETVLTGTIRTIDDKTREMIISRLEQIVAGVCTAFHADYEFNCVKQYPPTINDNGLNLFLQEVAGNLVNEDKIVVFDKPYMTAEDFAYYMKEIPGCMCFIGTKDDDHFYPLHHSNFNFSEEVLQTGAALLAAAAINYLNSGGDYNGKQE
jgi:amidohydrolase